MLGEWVNGTPFRKACYIAGFSEGRVAASESARIALSYLAPGILSAGAPLLCASARCLARAAAASGGILPVPLKFCSSCLVSSVFSPHPTTAPQKREQRHSIAIERWSLYMVSNPVDNAATMIVAALCSVSILRNVANAVTCAWRPTYCPAGDFWGRGWWWTGASP